MRRWILILGLGLVALFAWRWPMRPMKPTAPSPPSGQIIRFSTTNTFVEADSIQHQIVRDDQIDEHALEEISRGNPQQAAAAQYVAARYEYEHKRPESGLRYIERAEQLSPEDSSIRLLHAAILLEATRYEEAVAQAKESLRFDSKSSDAQRILGMAYYQERQLSPAIEAWERSLELHPDDALKQQLEKVRRELLVENNFVESRDSRFVIRYESGSLSSELIGDLFRTLESQYDEIARDLGPQNRGPITVNLYTRQQFTDVTRAPEWAGALNDGQLRIPLGEVTSISPTVQTVLRHELTHWFVFQMVRHCPVWLNEGVAQLEEGRTLSAFSSQVPEQLQTGPVPTLRELEKPFLEMSSDRAQIAYAESLVAAEYLRTNYGMDGVRSILVALGEGKSIEDALHSSTGLGYEELQRKVDESLGLQRASSGGPASSERH
jgi:tetratricopeptide (TPR) repeat protein